MRAVSTRPSGPEAKDLRALRCRRVIARLLVAGAVLLGAERVIADVPAPEAPETKTPRAIPLANLPDQLERDQALLEKIETRSASHANLETVEAPLFELLAEVEARQGDDLAELERVSTTRALEAVASGWVQRRAQISEIEQTFSARSSALARDLGELVDVRGRWEATRKAVAETGGSEVLLGRVNEVLAKIDTARLDVEQQIRPLVELETRITAAKEHIARVEQGVSDARRRLRMDMFRIDSPPLWAVRPDVTAYRMAFRDKVERSTQDVAVYARQNGTRLGWFAIASLAFMMLLIVLHRSAADWSVDDQASTRAAGILARPLAGGALIVLMAGVLVVFRDTPPLARGAIAIGLFWPMRRLLKVGILPGLQESLYAIAVWFVVDMVRSLLLPDGSLGSRTLLLGESLGAIWFVHWLRRPESLAHLGEAGLMMRAVGVALGFAAPLLAISAAANIAGNVSLAELIVQGILLALYLTYFVHAALGVLEATLRTLVRTRTAQHSRIVRYHQPLLIERGNRLLQWVATLLWLAVTARVFFVEDLLYDAVSGVLGASLRVGELDVSVGDIALFFLLISLSFVLARFLRFVLEEDVLARTSLPRGVPNAISTIASYAILLTGFVVAAAAAGVDIGRFTLVAGALGVGIGIGLQNVVNNFVSGLILLFERPIQLGDAVEVGGIVGTVRRIGMRSSTVRTYDGAEVVIPNSEFVSTKFTNWTLSDRNRRIRLPVGVAYGSDPEQVIQLLLGAAKGIEKIRAHPAPEAFFLGFGESALNFELRVWASSFDDGILIQSALSVAVNAALREAGIEVPFPQRDLHIRMPPAPREERG
jgi:potassium-dependent mechanosensitive channel